MAECIRNLHCVTGPAGGIKGAYGSAGISGRQGAVTVSGPLK